MADGAEAGARQDSHIPSTVNTTVGAAAAKQQPMAVTGTRESARFKGD